MSTLPNDYLSQMKQLLGKEFRFFLDTYQKQPHKSLRVNGLKMDPASFPDRISFSLKPVAWHPSAYYYDPNTDRPGKHVYHAAGLYYIQEASAMAPVIMLDPQPGEKILDLCAAPGGKTTQIASQMQGKGILLANEIDSQRVSALIENLERCGVGHSLVLNERPEHLAHRFAQYFDRVLVDAPCSGEGMFRKDPDTQERWSLRATEKCAELQLPLLSNAAAMLRVGGRLVYSTCTFNTTENEQVIEQFLQEHPEFELIRLPQSSCFDHGFDQEGKTVRLWPHHLSGEGHFVAVLRKQDQGTNPSNSHPIWRFPTLSKHSADQLQHFAQDQLGVHELTGTFTQFGEHVYQIAEELPSLEGLRVKRPGLYLGQSRRSHFQPAHAWALAMKNPPQQQIDFSPEDSNLYRYLRGETLSSAHSGWQRITVDSFPIGWGKASHGMLKNHYPKHLRWRQ